MYKNHFGFREAPFNVTPDPDFLWMNSTYMEAFATLQYGIEEKKGFIVVTGEVGTGKTTLLRKFMRTMGSSIHSVFIFNTYLTFTELLRLTLRDLGLPIPSEDRLTMIETLNGYLIEQLKNRHVVCLLIDEAQNLSDDALEGVRLLSNLETDKEKLIQIVLMGQPELKDRLDRPQLRQLKQRVVLECQLAPLQRDDVRSYIDFRLKAAGYEGPGLFRDDAIEKITYYSKGIPRLINVICDNSLLTAYAGSQKMVTPQMIEDAANDLRLGKRAYAKREASPADLETAGREAAAFRTREDDAEADRTWETGATESYPPHERRLARHRKRGWARAGIGLLRALIVLGLAGAFFYPKDAEDFLSYLTGTVEDLLGVGGESSALVRQGVTGGNPDSNEKAAPLVETKRPDRAASLPPDGELRARAEKTADGNAKSAERQAPSRASNDAESRRKKIELQIAKAIQNRAIEGVQVSVIDGTAFLKGRVETERQKSAAEQATRSVPDVKDIRNRIVVNSPEPER
jgi:general secretion pathway protein A